jgi:hypothetical protein
MDETLVELFAHHPLCDWFEGNLMDAFGAFIAGEEYGADETPELLGLYMGRYMIVFHPGELWQAVCENSDEANPCLVPIPGIDYMSRTVENDMLMVEHHSGESKMSDDEFEGCLWREDQLRPVTGGCIFAAWTTGTGYVC